MLLLWIVVVLAAVSFFGCVWCVASAFKIKEGWQNGHSPLARYLDARRRDRFEQQLPDALATMSNALRAGFSIAQAFDSVVEQGTTPISEEFRILQQQLRIGMSFEDALQSMTERVGSDDLSLVTTSLVISRRTGGNITEIFDKISETIRARMKVGRKVKTLTAQGRLQGVIVSLMPLFLGVLMTIIRPGLMLPFLFSPIGVVSVLAMMVLVLLGWLMIRKIVQIDV